MKQMLKVAGLLVVSLGFASATPVCTQGSLASYIALGSGGCQIDDKIFANFTYQVTTAGMGVVGPTADEVSVAPLVPPPGGILNPGPGIAFASGGWTVFGAGKFIDAAITFTVSIAPGYDFLINGASLQLAGNAINGGVAAVGETVADATDINNNLVLQAVLPFIGGQQAVLPNGPTKTVIVTKDIIVTTLGTTNQNAFASISLVTQRFSQVGTVIPEPGTMALMGAALLGVGLLRRRA
jgi:hypothetical protein